MPTPDAPRGWPVREGLDRRLLAGTTDDEVLRCFLDLVRGWRKGTPRRGLRLRQADLAVLVSILGTDGAEIERRLVAATACDASTARLCRRVLLAGLGALAVGLAFTPAVVSADLAADTATAATAAAPASAIQASVPEPHSSDPIDPPVAVTVVASIPDEAPVDPIEPPLVVTVDTPSDSIASLPDGTQALVSIARVGIDMPIVAGGQSVIDQGVVAHYTAPGWEPPVAAGAPGTYWLAAHHTTHGGPFRSLPDVTVGDEVHVTTSTQTFVYTVTSTEVVGLQPGDAAVYGTDPTASVILLQTCVNNTLRLLVHGTLTATS